MGESSGGFCEVFSKNIYIFIITINKQVFH
jgi:hypothetical protein